MNQLARFDTTALNRALVGFDRIFNDVDRRFANSVSNNYPPYNICKIDENLYEISIAVTGFEKDEVTVEVEGDSLKVSGVRKAGDESSAEEHEYLYRGLALRNFERSFTLAEHMKVITAEMKNGILSVRIEREVPEALKPRLIDIVEIK
jgi:molecular chaperone IbpA